MQLKKNIVLLIFLSFVIRLLSAYFFHDSKIENEWGILLNNLVQFQTYSLYSEGSFLIPSVLMPPLYAYFIYAIKILTFNSINFIYILLLLQQKAFKGLNGLLRNPLKLALMKYHLFDVQILKEKK